MKNMKLLILSCSEKKDENIYSIPALDRYKSPSFFIVKKHLREHTGDKQVIWILSAKYGLIEANSLIKFYDFKLSPAHIENLSKKVRKQSQVLHEKYFATAEPNQIFCNLSKLYLLVLVNYLSKFNNVQTAKGSFGEKGKMLKTWLDNN